MLVTAIFSYEILLFFAPLRLCVFAANLFFEITGTNKAVKSIMSNGYCFSRSYAAARTFMTSMKTSTVKDGTL